MTQTFTAQDLDRMESRYGLFYTASEDLTSAWPATHVGNGKTACICISRDAIGTLVNWRINDSQTGEVLLHSCERGYGRSKETLPIRIALNTVYGAGCIHRVRPGDKGPWGSGALYV